MMQRPASAPASPASSPTASVTALALNTRTTGSPLAHSSRREKHKLSSLGETASGAIAGALSRGLVAPLDVIKIRFQLQLEPVRQRYGARANELQGLYTGVLQAGRQLLKEEGVKTLWR
jgi:Mitochondrial carrier protein